MVLADRREVTSWKSIPLGWTHYPSLWCKISPTTTMSRYFLPWSIYSSYLVVFWFTYCLVEHGSSNLVDFSLVLLLKRFHLSWYFIIMSPFADWNIINVYAGSSIFSIFHSYPYISFTIIHCFPIIFPSLSSHFPDVQYLSYLH